uniref:Hemocyanin II n=1 Tax=Anthurium amnicola TaxID=1678845 RepID=A0A1D1Z5L3_9ARAE
MTKKGKKAHNPQQESVNDFLKVPKHFRKDQARVKNHCGFTPFDPDQLEEATKLSAKFMEIANNNPDNAVDKVLECAKETSETTDPELVRWSLMLFISHHPSARDKHLRIPSLAKRAPQSTVPRKKKRSPLAPGPILGSDKEVAQESEDVERFMDWFREDPNLNEHHEHWHVVYSPGGIPDPKNPDKIIHKDRHAELFIYMHRQMLARYDIERLALGIPLIEPFDDYDAPIPQAYTPNKNLRDEEDDYTTFGDREANAKLGDVDTGRRIIKVSDMKETLRKILESIDSGKLVDGTELNIDLLGGIIEPYNYDRKDYDKHYGVFHGIGHVALGYISNPSRAQDEAVDPGVMHVPRVAARDPVFWRWHRHVDNVAHKWEEKQPPNDFSNQPPVKIRDGDIILTFKDKLPITHGENQDAQASEFGEREFGGDKFDTDVSQNEYVTHTLETKMKVRSWDHYEDSGIPEDIDHLFPREFYYFFRVENTSSSTLEATFRVFLAPEELAESRRHWIELDKFKSPLPPNSKTVVSRDCDMSAVVRQPPQKTDEEMDETSLPTGEDSRKDFCDCGWPFHLLLPRGRKGGMKFKLLVFITDWAEDEVPRLSRCGSISFCGAEGAREKYPDKKPMGYPLNKPFKNNSYEETFAGLNNATIRDVSINWVDDFPEIVAET